MTGLGKSVVIGGVAAVALMALSLALYAGGMLRLPRSERDVSRLLVIATAPDAEGVDVAEVAFVLDRDREEVALVDVRAAATVPGTSATSARDAYPFGGGDAVATALAPQTGGVTLGWVVLPSAVWEGIVDDAGGLTLDVPRGVSAYRDGKLTVVESGRRRVSGADVVALVSASAFLADEQGKAVSRQVSAGLSSLVGMDTSLLAGAVDRGEATTSLKADEIARSPVARP